MKTYKVLDVNGERLSTHRTEGAAKRAMAQYNRDRIEDEGLTEDIPENHGFRIEAE